MRRRRIPRNYDGISRAQRMRTKALSLPPCCLLFYGHAMQCKPITSSPNPLTRHIFHKKNQQTTNINYLPFLRTKKKNSSAQCALSSAERTCSAIFLRQHSNATLIRRVNAEGETAHPRLSRAFLITCCTCVVDPRVSLHSQGWVLAFSSVALDDPGSKLH